MKTLTVAIFCFLAIGFVSGADEIPQNYVGSWRFVADWNVDGLQHSDEKMHYLVFTKNREICRVENLQPETIKQAVKQKFTMDINGKMTAVSPDGKSFIFGYARIARFDNAELLGVDLEIDQKRRMYSLVKLDGN